MRVLLAVMLLGCAGDPEGSSTKATAPIPTTASTFERLHDRAGAVPGMSSFRVVHRVDPNHCGGIAVTVERNDEQMSASDLPLENVLEIRFPTALDFSEPHKAAGLKKFTVWVDHMSALASAGRAAYSNRMMREGATTKERVIAAARIVQVQRHLASILVRAEIPLDARTADDKTAAFCDRIAEVAEPIMLAGEGAAKVCANHAGDIGPGWWTDVCTFTSSATASADPSTSP